MSNDTSINTAALENAELCIATKLIATYDHILTKEVELLVSKHKNYLVPLTFSATFLIALLTTTFKEWTIFSIVITNQHYKAFMFFLLLTSLYFAGKNFRVHKKMGNIGEYFLSQLRLYKLEQKKD